MYTIVETTHNGLVIAIPITIMALLVLLIIKTASEVFKEVDDE